MLLQRGTKSEIYFREAMRNWDWMFTNCDPKLIVTRTTVHGFHYKSCVQKKYHSPHEKGERGH
jgi:hypothetical protein